MEMNFKLHTIIMLVGPTECGKSTFSTDILMPNLQFKDERSGYISNVQYFSSDQIRQELLGYPYDKYDENMLEASQQAFNMLYFSLRQVTSYPINADFVIVDTIGLSELHRQEVQKIAEENEYNVSVVVFDYRKRDNYFISERSKKIISSHLRRLKEDVLPVLSKEGYDNIYRIKEKNFLEAADSYQVSIPDYEQFMATQLAKDSSYAIVGDVHEQIDALKSLVCKHQYEIDAEDYMVPRTTQAPIFVLVGDFIDKGGRTEETIEFLYKNKQYFHFVLGNHENFVTMWLEGKVSAQSIEQDTLENYFTSIKVLESNEALRLKFLELVHAATPFAHYNGRQTPSFYVTHAPTEPQYIGKLSKKARKNQRNYRLERDAKIEPQLAFLQTGFSFNAPLYFFGHVMSQKPIKLGKVMGIDTGAGSNAKLTVAYIAHGRVMMQQAQISDTPTEVLPELFPFKRKEKTIVMDEKLIKKISYFAEEKINYFAGTISPADKDEDELESLKQGLDFYASKGVDEVVLQPKYMGSRCTIYLFKDIQKCYATSRRGHIINQVNLEKIYRTLHERLASYFAEHNIEMMILDGELMPWKALGEDLINQSFIPIANALTIEQQILADTGFYQLFEQTLSNPAYKKFIADQSKMAKKDLIEQYGSNEYQTFSEAHKLALSMGNSTEQAAAIKVYQEQVVIYGKDEEIHYKPFAILKMLHLDGTETFPQMTTTEMYHLLNDDEILTLNLSEADAYAKATAYFNTLTTAQQMEGIVIKPQNSSDIQKAAPHMKVRNPEYLSIIYGYNYRTSRKYQALLKNKRIGRKVRASIDEYILGQKLLSIPYAKISAENIEYTETVAKLLGEMERSEVIDPRL